MAAVEALEKLEKREAFSNGVPTRDVSKPLSSIHRSLGVVQAEELGWIRRESGARNAKLCHLTEDGRNRTLPEDME